MLQLMQPPVVGVVASLFDGGSIDVRGSSSALMLWPILDVDPRDQHRGLSRSHKPLGKKKKKRAWLPSFPGLAQPLVPSPACVFVLAPALLCIVPTGSRVRWKRVRQTKPLCRRVCT